MPPKIKDDQIFNYVAESDKTFVAGQSIENILAGKREEEASKIGTIGPTPWQQDPTSKEYKTMMELAEGMAFGSVGWGSKSAKSYLAKKIQDIARSRRISSSRAVQYAELSIEERLLKKAGLDPKLLYKGNKINPKYNSPFKDSPFYKGKDLPIIDRRKVSYPTPKAGGKRKGYPGTEDPPLPDPEMPW